ncbi:MAG: hypothetical protein WAQ99_01025 [Pyrinomonadaceae bacterium]
MAKLRSDASQPVASTDQSVRGRPEVILEFLFDRGMLLVALRNIGQRPAIATSVQFDKKIVGLGGLKDISTLPVFRQVEFLGPGREIVVFVDQSHSYFARKQPTKISARISYSDSEKQKYDTTINHDLEIYRNLPYLTLEHHCIDQAKD